VSLHKVEEREGEAGAATGEAAPFAGDAEILTGEAAGPEGGSTETLLVLPAISDGDMSGLARPALNVSMNASDVTEVRDSGPPGDEDRRGVRVDLGVTDGAPACPLKAQIESADSGEERGVRELTGHVATSDP
jgi:hypothetical protein